MPGSAVPPDADRCPRCYGVGSIAGSDAARIQYGPVDATTPALPDEWVLCPLCGPKWRAEKAKGLWSRAGIPEGFSEASFATFSLDLHPPGKARASVEEALWKTKALAAGDGPVLLTLVSETPGTGKTHLACAMLRHVIHEQGIESRYISGAEMASRARDFSRRDDVEGGADFVESLRQIPVLVLDDIGTEHSSPYLQSVYHAVIDTRYAARLRSMFISNCPYEELDRHGNLVGGLKHRLGYRAIDRLTERGTGTVAIIEAESVRERRPT